MKINCISQLQGYFTDTNEDQLYITVTGRFHRYQWRSTVYHSYRDISQTPMKINCISQLQGDFTDTNEDQLYITVTGIFHRHQWRSTVYHSYREISQILMMNSIFQRFSGRRDRMEVRFQCNQCLLRLKLWVRIPFMTRCTQICQWHATGFLLVLRFPPPKRIATI
jgi:hypothetical protein